MVAEYLFKVSIIGLEGVGKTTLQLTSILEQYADNWEGVIGGVNVYNSKKELIGSVGGDVPQKYLELDGDKVTLMIWDSPLSYDKNIPGIINGATFVLFCYNLAEANTLTGAYELVKQVLELDENPLLGLVGCKSDLVNDYPKVDDTYNFDLDIKTSSKNMTNIRDLWIEVAKICLKNVK